MLDLIHHILSNDSDVTATASTRIHAMMRPQKETFPSIVFGLTDSKFEQVNTLGAVTGKTKSASDVYSIGVACMDSNLSTAFALHEKVRAAMVNTTAQDIAVSPNEYEVHGIHITDVVTNVLDEGEVYVFEGVYEVKVRIK